MITFLLIGKAIHGLIISDPTPSIICLTGKQKAYKQTLHILVQNICDQLRFILQEVVATQTKYMLRAAKEKCQTCLPLDPSGYLSIMS